MPIALYIRKSVERENSISCETQLEYCKNMLKPNEKNDEILTFVDNGFSGGNVNRKGFLEMMRQIKSGKISKVVVYRLDRISRSLADFVNILSVFRLYGVEFVSSQESFDTQSPYGELIVKILAVFAEFERSSIISRVTQSYEHRSEMGFFMGGKTPFGYRLSETQLCGAVTKMLVSDEEKAPIVAFAFGAYLKPDGSLLKTSELVNKTFGTKFSPSTLSTMMKNPVYVAADSKVYTYFAKKGVKISSDPSLFDGVHGLMHYGKTKGQKGKIVVMPHVGIVASNIWLACNRKLERSKKCGKTASADTSLLVGSLVCGKCGKRLTLVNAVVNKNGEVRRYFVCHNKKSCNGLTATLYAESLENAVSSALCEFLATLPKPVVQSKHSLCEINKLQNSINAVEAKQKKLISFAISRQLNDDMTRLSNYEASELSKEKEQLCKRLSELENDNLSTVDIDYASAWRNADAQTKKAMLSCLVKRISADNDGNVEIVLQT